MSPLSGSHMRSPYLSLQRSTSLLFCIYSIMASSTVFSHASILDGSSDLDSNSTCDQLKCKNGNSCQMSLSNKNTSDWSGHSARCLCRGKWTGRTCEQELRLIVSSVQSESAFLDLQQVLSNPANSNAQPLKTHSSVGVEEFSIFLWNVNSFNECRILQFRTNSPYQEKIHLKGLKRGEKYLACFSNGHIDSCSFFSEKSMEYFSQEHSCVEFVAMVHGINSAYTRFIATACVVAVFFLVLFLFVYVHRRIFVIQLCLHIICCRSCRYRHAISRAKKNGDARRMRKQMRDVSGDVLMPDDIPIEFDEFEDENDLSSALYSSGTLRVNEDVMGGKGEFSELKLLPRRPTSLATNIRLVGQPSTENCDFLYENQKLISPIYSPQDHNVMKLAFLDDDLVVGGHCEGQGQETKDVHFRTGVKETPLLDDQRRENALQLPRDATLPDEIPFYPETYLSEMNVIHYPRFLARTLPRSFMRRASTSSNNRKFDFLCRRRSLYSYQGPDLLLSTLPSINQKFSPGFGPVPFAPNFSPFSLPAFAQPKQDTSPEIEYSDASGDYRYPPALSGPTSPHQSKTVRNFPTRSFTAHDIKMRNLRFPRTKRHERPRSMPTDYFLQQHDLAFTPENFSRHSETPTYMFPHLPPNFIRFDKDLLNTSSHIPSIKTFPPTICRYPTDSFTHSKTQPQSQRPMFQSSPLDTPLSLSALPQNRDEMFTSLNTLPRTNKSKPKHAYTIQSSHEASKTGTFLSHSLPRVKKPKFSFDSESPERTHKRETFQSHTLPRGKELKPIAASHIARRPHRLNLKSRTPDFPRNCMTSAQPFSEKGDVPKSPIDSFQTSKIVSSSLSSSPSKPATPKQVKTLLGHFETNLFSRATSTTTNDSENQEFLDLQSPIAEGRTKPGTKGKARKIGKWALNRMSSKGESDFTGLADDTYKCFFKAENIDLDTEGDNTSLDLSNSLPYSFPKSDRFSTTSTPDLDKGLSKTNPSRESNLEQPLNFRAGSISCFAENTVNLVTPFCAELDISSSIGRREIGCHTGDVSKTSQTLETLQLQEEAELFEENKDTCIVNKSQAPLGCYEVELDFDELKDLSKEPKEWEVIV